MIPSYEHTSAMVSEYAPAPKRRPVLGNLAALTTYTWTVPEVLTRQYVDAADRRVGQTARYPAGTLDAK